jgi:murein DD-endopeptidase MepM/ murein hydrolase activator NlpD
VLDRPFNRGERVARGQQLGSVGAAGMVGNNGLPHVHMELHLHGRSGHIVPFSASNGGLPLDGWDLPFTDASNEHAMDSLIMSTNALSAAPPQAVLPPAMDPPTADALASTT